jgi:hypothetical protein
MTRRPAVRTAVRRPGAGVAIDSSRLVRMRETRQPPLSRADLALKMSNGPCPSCRQPYSHEADCPNAGQFSITPDAIAKIENGHRHPKPVTLGVLCMALGCQPEDLLPDDRKHHGPCKLCAARYGHEPGCPNAT